MLKKLLATMATALATIVSMLVLAAWWTNREYETATLLTGVQGMYRYDVQLLERAQALEGTTLRCPAGSLGPALLPRAREYTYSSCVDCEPVEVARIGVSCDDGALTYTFLDAPTRFLGKTLVFELPPDAATSRAPRCRGGTLGWPDRPRSCA
jgi:hypothetical protein